ncbi:MAG: glycosyltransferase, partial [Pseudomonadota bacterium]
EVFPRIHERVPQARFYIVGGRPAEAVLELNRLPGVQVTGKVPDVRPYLAHAVAAVAPLRIARGVQNKVLEALAMARPVLATTAAAEGIEGDAGLLLADDAQMQADLALRLLRGEVAGSRAGRECVVRRYNWNANLARFERLLEGDAIATESTDAMVAA